MIHNIRYRVFIYENEDKDKVLEALLNILPTAEPEAEEAEGLLEEKMLILTGAISKKRETKEFLNTLIESIGEDQLIKLYNDLDRKMDEKGNLFLRLSKEKALDEEWEILDGGDSIHLKIKIAAYPAKKEVALKKIKEVFPEDIINA
ncbi:exosome subunit [Methanobrevibacter ruminantium M1]|uniref:Exosome subunit n=1 Tax=Methanobrevibacter ruminantium (strain ATCC 35063 / DSM 1093 / JCM 13430 / OCM 146 / M1) TaxID=634498 RepID=D3E3V0_METRM|nr:RNA-binding protein [Methanobrevibacter ruminantium]ADC47211.1 exosome subunit [Methanobrevibacter ruminantium M1]